MFAQREGDGYITSRRPGDPLALDLLALSIAENAVWTPSATATPEPEPVAVAPAAVAQRAPQPARAPAPIAPVADPDLAQRVLAALNATRANSGLPALASDGRLSGAASSYAMLLAKRNLLTHVGPDGSTMGSRVAAMGYPTNVTLGEVIGAGPASWDAPDFVDAWLASAAHRAVILDRGFASAGVGCVVVAGASVRCVVDFGG